MTGRKRAQVSVVSHRSQIAAKCLWRGSDDYRRLAEQHAAKRTECKPASGVFTAQTLRLSSHHLQREQECWSLMFHCGQQAQRCTMRAYQHGCLVRAYTAQPTVTAAQTLRQVAADFDTATRHADTGSPPGDCCTLPPLSTCHASNAPGVDRHATQQGVMAT